MGQLTHIKEGSTSYFQIAWAQFRDSRSGFNQPPAIMASASARYAMFWRASGRLPRLSVSPATFATAKKVPEESSRSV